MNKIYSYLSSQGLSYIIVFFGLVSLSSCYSYKPSYINSPIFQEEGQVDLNVNLGSGVGANIAYSPVEHFGLLAEYSARPVIESELTGGSYFNQDGNEVRGFIYADNFYALAAGTFWKYGENLYQDFYIGYGQGNGSYLSGTNLDFNFNGSFNLDAFESEYENIYFQSSLKVLNMGDFSLSLDSRVNWLRFQSFDYTYTYAVFSQHSNQLSQENIEELDEFFSNRNRLASQLGITLGAKMKYFDIFSQFQLGVAEREVVDFFQIRPVSLYFGISLNLNQFAEGN